MATELLLPGTTGQQMMQQSLRGISQETTGQQRLILPTSGALVDTAKTNHFNLVPGHYGDYVGNKPSVFAGVAGTTLGKGTYKSTTQAANIAHLDAVSLHPTASGQWTNSQFTSVTVSAGAKAKYTSCTFTGTVDNSKGKASDVVLIGCVFPAGSPPINCTII